MTDERASIVDTFDEPSIFLANGRSGKYLLAKSTSSGTKRSHVSGSQVHRWQYGSHLVFPAQGTAVATWLSLVDGDGVKRIIRVRDTRERREREVQRYEGDEQGSGAAAVSE